jgi:branched-chain amino acid aminotransferase
MTVEPIIYVNGEFVPESRARISVLDHAVLYGDGVFETACAWGGRIFKLDAHLDRCFRSMTAIALKPPVSRDDMRDLIVEAARLNGFENAYIKWIVTRGANGRPLMDPAGCVANLIILVQPYINRAAADRAAAGLKLKTVAIRRPSGDVLDPHIKSLNYLNLVMAKIEAKAAGADEALLLDRDGRICEVSGCNIFVLHGTRLRTPGRNILRGITRDSVIEFAPALGFTVEEADLELYEAYTADEIVICSTAGGLLPVVGIDGRIVGSGTPGAAFANLSAAYRKLLASSQHGTEIGLVIEAAK